MFCIRDDIAYWSRYVPHYIHPEGIVSLQLQYIVPYERIISLLPDFDMTSGVDGLIR